MTMHKLEVEIDEEQIRAWAKSCAKSHWSIAFCVACRKWVKENPELMPVTVMLTPDEVKARASRRTLPEADVFVAGWKFDNACREMDL